MQNRIHYYSASLIIKKDSRLNSSGAPAAVARGDDNTNNHVGGHRPQEAHDVIRARAHRHDPAHKRLEARQLLREQRQRRRHFLVVVFLLLLLVRLVLLVRLLVLLLLLLADDNATDGGGCCCAVFVSLSRIRIHCCWESGVHVVIHAHGSRHLPHILQPVSRFDMGCLANLARYSSQPQSDIQCMLLVRHIVQHKLLHVAQPFECVHCTGLARA